MEGSDFFMDKFDMLLQVAFKSERLEANRACMFHIFMNTLHVHTEMTVLGERCGANLEVGLRSRAPDGAGGSPSRCDGAVVEKNREGV